MSTVPHTAVPVVPVPMVAQSAGEPMVAPVPVQAPPPQAQAQPQPQAPPPPPPQGPPEYVSPMVAVRQFLSRNLTMSLTVHTVGAHPKVRPVVFGGQIAQSDNQIWFACHRGLCSVEDIVGPSRAEMQVWSTEFAQVFQLLGTVTVERQVPSEHMYWSEMPERAQCLFSSGSQSMVPLFMHIHTIVVDRIEGMLTPERTTYRAGSTGWTPDPMVRADLKLITATRKRKDPEKRLRINSAGKLPAYRLIGRHFPQRGDRQTDCVWCGYSGKRFATTYECIECGVALCLNSKRNCFLAFHTTADEDLPEKKSRPRRA